MAQFRNNLAIDLGTASVLVYKQGKGVVLNEPSVVAMDTFTRKVHAVGSSAKKMLGRTPGNITATRPMKDGVIADFDSTEQMLRYFIGKANRKTLLKPNIIICVPSEATQVQKRAVIQASSNAGASKTFLIEEPLAAAIGAGIDIADPGGSLIIDIGGGTTDVAIISLGGIVINKSIKVAGDACDEAIMEYIRKKFNLLIGERTAEEIKIYMGSAILDEEDDRLFEVRGRNLINGLPQSVLVNSMDIYEALYEPIKEILDVILYIVDKTPPELSADLLEKGAVMTGGGSLIKGLNHRIEDMLGINVTIADEPLSSVVKGTGKALESIDELELKESSFSDARRKTVEKQEMLRKR